MDDEKNIKLLGKIFLIVFIIIFGIIVLSLVKYIFSVNNYEYELPNRTTAKVQNDYKVLSEGKRLEYNKKFNAIEFLIPINSVIRNKMEYNNINLLQNEESRFIYSYTRSYLNENKEGFSYDEINTANKDVFNSDLTLNIITKFSINDLYVFDVNLNLDYCFKPFEIKEEGDKTMVKFKVVNYNATYCNENYLDIDESMVVKEAILTVSYNKKKDKYYINSFMLMKKKG